MDDLISRQAAIAALATGTWYDENGYIMEDQDEKEQIIADFLEMVPPAQQWIPCRERLPEDGRMVLTTIYGTDLIVLAEGETLEEVLNRNRKMARVSVGFLYDDGWCGADGFPEIVTPSAWMPLPEPWEGEDNMRNLAYADQDTLMPAT